MSQGRHEDFRALQRVKEVVARRLGRPACFEYPAKVPKCVRTYKSGVWTCTAWASILLAHNNGSG